MQTKESVRSNVDAILNIEEWSHTPFFSCLLQAGRGDPVLSTGSRAIDEALGGGLYRGCHYILQGKRGIGKTAFALQLAASLGKNKIPVVYVSTQMTEIQIACRLLASEAGVSPAYLMRGHLSPDEWKKVAQATNVFTKSNKIPTCT